MASDDVLERAERLLAKCPGYELPPYTDTLIVEDLAAEVRELRRDKARLDWLGKVFHSPLGYDDASCIRGVLRWMIDAAMGREDFE